ncbi:GDNF family receptor alpha-4-like [Kryptolebias marmoratus]|uniref:GDNF family receptor alpha-4-like n=1 Tax=Kryptolebias marmoratus TaxID=37003 RepID=UPI0018AD0241|nr:GDNF family receptor alpha-4-like [Kryptolebias marmoratus]
MVLLGIVLVLLVPGVLPSPAQIFPFPPLATDCVEAHRVCSTDPQCEALYHGLELCAAEAAVSTLGEQVASECLERQDDLLAKHPSLLTCKCQRGFRKEERCLRIYWRVRLLPGKDELEISPYDDSLIDTRMASLVAASSFMQMDDENQCLKAAQDCGLYEKCGSLRSEYVLACTKPMPGSNRCNQYKCHRALRRFLERVPEEYSLGVLFCPCTNTLCGERRRKTIVPSCSYQDMETLQPNCLHQQSFCRRDDLCRSRLADFLSNCQPSHQTASGCLKDSTGLCLRAYAGLIGLLDTQNKVLIGNYTNVYAPIIVHSDSEPDEYLMQFPEESTDNVTAADIISELSAKITSSSLSRFNINRANVWDGALRGFKLASFNTFNEIFVKFTDDEGQAEDGVDNSGPKREFLSLLMNCLRTRRVFDGPEERKFITFDSEGCGKALCRSSLRLLDCNREGGYPVTPNLIQLLPLLCHHTRNEPAERERTLRNLPRTQERTQESPIRYTPHGQTLLKV